ncbi:MAG: hypothetical protein HN348_13510 [Proteobacteria bacterium]|nr:hypothetical protein [Pseudomonadota bacterium]
MKSDHLLWIRDWAILGGLTSTLAPAPMMFLGGGIGQFVIVAAVAGTLTGALVGLLVRLFLGQAPKRSWIALSAILCPPALATWGSSVAGIAAASFDTELIFVAMPCGSVAAFVQLSWFAPLYAWLALRGYARWPIVLTVGSFIAPLGGFLGMVAVLFTMDFLGLWGV